MRQACDRVSAAGRDVRRREQHQCRTVDPEALKGGPCRSHFAARGGREASRQRRHCRIATGPPPILVHWNGGFGVPQWCRSRRPCARASLGLADPSRTRAGPIVRPRVPPDRRARPAYRRGPPRTGRLALECRKARGGSPSHRAAIELDPRSAEAHLGLADALSMAGRSTKAQRAYERAAELDAGIERRYYGTSDGWGRSHCTRMRQRPRPTPIVYNMTGAAGGAGA